MLHKLSKQQNRAHSLTLYDYFLPGNEPTYFPWTGFFRSPVQGKLIYEQLYTTYCYVLRYT